MQVNLANLVKCLTAAPEEDGEEAELKGSPQREKRRVSKSNGPMGRKVPASFFNHTPSLNGMGRACLSLCNKRLSFIPSILDHMGGHVTGEVNCRGRFNTCIWQVTHSQSLQTKIAFMQVGYIYIIRRAHSPVTSDM